LSTDESTLLFSSEETNVLCMPIIHKDEVRGMVIFGEFRSKERDPLDDRKVYLCQAMVSLIGSAIEISRLFSQLKDQSEEVVLAMAEAVEKKSPWTAGHSKRVTRYALVIAKAMGWDENRMEELRVTGLLHDIGKIGVPGLILNKAGKLTDVEYAIVKRHPEDGAQILSKMRLFHVFIPAIRHHHEWYNGKGYPDGLRESEIPLAARILAVADAFDAMTADRPYRKGLMSEEAMRRLQEGAGEQFDPEIVEIFKLAYKD
jgi:putative nucleotidyltransferase with HDIG domain